MKVELSALVTNYCGPLITWSKEISEFLRSNDDFSKMQVQLLEIDCGNIQFQNQGCKKTVKKISRVRSLLMRWMK